MAWELNPHTSLVCYSDCQRSATMHTRPQYFLQRRVRIEAVRQLQVQSVTTLNCCTCTVLLSCLPYAALPLVLCCR
jgi:hypothetical protein